MNESAIYKMQDENFAPTSRPDPTPIYVSVRTGNAASPAIDMSAVNAASEKLQTTLEELDGACG